MTPPPGWTRTSLYFGFLFLALGAHLPFWPLWLSDWGLSEAEVGAYTAAALAARMAFGAVPAWAADRLGAPRASLAMLAVAGTAIYLGHLFIDTRPVLFAATLGAAAVLTGILPIADALSLRAAARGGFAYATARSVGSAAFLFANLAGGAAVAIWGSQAALWWIVVALAPLIWLGAVHPGGEEAPVERPRLTEAARLLRSPAFLAVTIGAASLMGAHATLYAYGSIHWRARGVGDAEIGALWAFGVAVEVAIMAGFGARLTARLGPAGMMALSGAAGLVRWTAMALEPPLVMLWPLQALHGLTFTAAHLGVMAFLHDAVPARLGASAQALSGVVAGGLAMAGLTAASALVYPQHGAGAYWIAVGASLVGLTAALWLSRVWTDTKAV